MAAGHLDAVAVALGVADEVVDAAFEDLRPHPHHRVAGIGNVGCVAGDARLPADLVEHGGDVGFHRVLVAVAAGEGEVAVEHAVHVVDVFLQLLCVGRSLDQR